ncbi:lysosomal thioesterase PPT2 homolog [Drosophila grimshawi]|uniref:palmitoyl-CoA hydrolase n=1 Tax=Drosophila grimshawi TaxID=7222 RepID=B4JPJ2_DROGR|nr:lysosomal thioesterase PPT2 homolog [Drosophila grimshawi]EDV98822.1 GH13391 [Drosophila grimshawi]
MRIGCWLILCMFFMGTLAYKPVVILHGILSGAESMTLLVRHIEKLHPGTVVYNCDEFPGWYSLENAWRQVAQIRDYIDRIGKLHPDGFIVLGYSQGGLLARAAIQSLPDHKVTTFISLSSPQAGQYGTSFLHLIFPDLAAKTAFELFYSRVGQYTSVGGYWNDPHKQSLYMNYSEFLPLINNEKISSNSTSFKMGMVRLDKVILIGGPDDGVITPWQSSHFSYFDDSLDVIPFYERGIYINDSIGLKTLLEADKLIIIVKPSVHHLSWHRNKKVINEVIMPYLD